MLRVEQQGSRDGFGVGQRSSRVESIDTANPIERVATNGHVNGINGRSMQTPTSPRLASSPKRSPEAQFSGRSTLKRNRDERDEDDHETNGNYRMQFSRSGIAHPRSDPYSPKNHNGSVSPADIRHAFVPERSDHWKPNKRHQHWRESSGSSNAAHRQGRTDQWIPGMVSSPRSPSPPTRPPLGPRAISASSNLYRSAPKQPMRERRGSESVENTKYSNLKWTAPGLKPTQITNDSTQRTPATIVESPLSPVEAPKTHVEEASVSRKTTVNGIIGVPTGPKGDPRVLPPISEVNRRRPCIFISGKSLRPNTLQTVHLQGYLREFVHNMSDIAVDDTGYYIFFENTDAGLHRLDQCYRAKNRDTMDKLFGQYSLEMVRCPQGLDNTTRNADQRTYARPRAERFSSIGSDINKQAEAAIIKAASKLPTPPQAYQSTTMADSVLEPRQMARASSLTVERPANDTPPTLRHSSPLRVPSRQDRDDTSSSLSFTGSDLSLSRVPKCHACEKTPASDSDSLVQCSSCPRRWHRRCHKEAIPEMPGLEQTWQCRRCIKKNVPPKSMLSNASFVSASPAPSVGQTEEPPIERPQFTYTTPAPASTAVADVQALTLSNGLPHQEPELDLDEGDMDLVMTTAANIPEIETTSVLAPHVNTDRLRMSEADDLVERSFALTGETKKPEEKTKLLLNLTKKKLIRPEPNAAAEIHDRDESVTVESEDYVVSAQLEGQVTEANAKADTPKRERHKWKGGGADKNIIQAGMPNFFSEKSAHDEQTGTTHARNRSEQMSPITPVLRADIPESLEDSATVYNANGHSKETGSQQVSVQTSPKPRLKINGPRPSTGQMMNAPKPQAGPAQRMKPGGISADKCKKCGKTIAFNPAGTKMCSKCKKKAASADTNMSPAAETPIALRPSEQNMLPTEFKAAQINDSIGALLNSLRPEEDEGDVESLRSKSPPTVEDEEPGPEFPKTMRPCDTCRARHKRCTHRTDGYASDLEHEDTTHEDTARDDLDFWNTVPDENNTERIEKPIFDDRLAQTNHGPDTITGDRNASSSLSPAPDEVPSFATDAKKRIRVSHSRAAISEYDLGDAHERPKNTYIKLIGMALCDAPDYRLKGSEINRWIADNIPGYYQGKGTGWESGISATLSMNRQKGDNPGLWKKIGGDGPKKNDPCWYQLLPDKEHEMLHWDPVLKQPVSPMKRPEGTRCSKRTHKPVEKFTAHDTSLEENWTETPASPTHAPKRRLKLKAGKTPSIARKHAPRSVGDAGLDSHTMHEGTANSDIEIDELAPDFVNNNQEASSDEEPIAASRKKRSTVLQDVPATPLGIEKNGDVRSREGLGSVNKLSEGNLTRKSANSSIMQPFNLPSRPIAVDTKVVAQAIEEEFKNADHSAKSLFDEWPELDPANEFDREAKIEEIRRRPTRKQKFGVRGHECFSRYPAVAWEAGQRNDNDMSSYTPLRPNRSSRNFDVHVFGWQANDHVQQFDSLEAMFDLPDPRFPIIQEGQIAYRDGIRSEFDEAPRRAKRIYNTGYAKHN